MSYSLAKVVHVVAVVLWIGPPLGAYYLLVQAHRGRDPARIVWAERHCERVLIAEHVAFLVLVVSGLLMLYSVDWTLLEQGWMRAKLHLVALVVLFEAFDMWLAHVVFRKLLATDAEVGSPPWRKASRMRLVLAGAGMLIVVVILPAIFWFAVAKPA